MHHPKDRIAHITAFVTPVVEHWMELEIAQWVDHEGSIRRPTAWWANALTMKLHLGPTKEGNILFNGALNTFYLRLYGVRHMVKNHSDWERGNSLPPHRLLFPCSSKGSFYMHHPTDRITHTTAFVTPVVGHWLEREIAQWVHHEGFIAPWADALPWSCISLQTFINFHAKKGKKEKK